MLRFRSFRWFPLVCCLLLTETGSSRLPACKLSPNNIEDLSVLACQNFVKLLENPEFCNLDHGQDRLVLLHARVPKQGYCWEGFSPATIGLIRLLHKHCEGHHPREAKLTSSNIRVFVGVLTASANVLQRQAGIANTSDKNSVQGKLGVFQ